MMKKAVRSISAIQCNVCGRKIEIINDVLKEDVFETAKEWGYFSNKDMEVHKFNICESCYDKMISEFKVPVKIKKKREAL